MILKITLKNSELLGIYLNLTNKYLILPNKNSIKEKTILEKICKKNIRIINTSIGESSLVGCLSIGNDNGLCAKVGIKLLEFLFIRKSLPKSINIAPIQISFNNPSAILSVNNNLLLTNLNQRKSTIQFFNSILKCKCLMLNNLDFTLNKFSFPMNNFHALTSFIPKKIFMFLTSVIQIPIFCVKFHDNYKFIGSRFVLNDEIFIVGKTFKLEWLRNTKYII